MERIITFDYGMAIVLATAPTLARGYSGVMGSSFARSCTDVVSLCNFDRDCEWCLSRMGQWSQCWQFPTSLDVEADIALSSVCEHLNDEYCCLVESCHGNYLLAEVLGERSVLWNIICMSACMCDTPGSAKYICNILKCTDVC